MRRSLHFILTVFCAFSPSLAFGTVLFKETFEDQNFGSRGWYDAPSGTVTTAQHTGTGSTASFECHVLQGAQGCAGGNPARHAFTATETLYVDYWVKYSVANQTSLGSHLFYVLTDVDPAFSGLSSNHLTVYVEQDTGHQQLRIQDAANIDQNRIGVNLVGITENRGLAGCNGQSDAANHYVSGPYSDGDCFATPRVNGRTYREVNQPMTFTDTNWHHVEAYMKMNTLVSGIGQQNGELRVIVDGQVIFDYTDVVLRTGAHPTAKFNQFIVGTYIGAGSPVDQYFWIDDLKVMTVPPSADVTPPSPPQNLRVL